MHTLDLGISTCPNDVFIFHALMLGLVQVPDVSFDTRLADVEELNQWAASGEPHVCKVSAAAASGVLDRYAVSRTGAALGRGVGPVLVAGRSVDPCKMHGLTVAVPGLRTTARLLLDLFCRELGVRPVLREVVFDRIAGLVESGEAAAGVLIHEGRFTYQGRGLFLLQDLGRWWENRFSAPLPLGVILIRRDLGPELSRRVETAIGASLSRARAKPDQAWEDIRKFAQELDHATIRRHIDTFVTGYSDDLGEEGVRALGVLLAAAGWQGSAEELLVS
ncbi:MAG: 1,4-dihydroxy-6-naphthoate synthase [Desulfovibrionaceae bacterium]